MLRNLIAKASLIFRGNNKILRPFKQQIVIQSKFCSSNPPNPSVEKWISILPEDERKRVKYIQNEIALRTAEFKKMPRFENIQIEDYEEMLQMTNSRRHRYYEYLYSLTTTKINDNIKKIIRQKIIEEKAKMGILGKDPENKHIEYGLGKSTLLIKVTRRTMMSWRNQKLYRAMILNEPPLIFDCGFNESMSNLEITDTARQLKYAFSCNRLHRRPFVMHLCNLNKESPLWHELNVMMPNFSKLPIKLHEEDITEVFPKDRLVYLSPDSENVLESFNADDHYVVGSIVDKRQQLPLTLAKSKQLNIRSARLPLHKYLNFRSFKTLTLDQMMNIMLELKTSGDWRRALSFVPSRKIF